MKAIKSKNTVITEKEWGAIKELLTEIRDKKGGGLWKL